MKKYYLFILAIVVVLACNSDSEKNSTTTTDNTIVPTASKKSQQLKADTRVVSSREKKEETTFEKLSTFTEESYKGLISKLTPKIQKFSIPINIDTTIKCNQGTIIKVDAGSFVSRDWGKSITGDVELRIREFYDLSDMVLAGLSTTSGKQLLETGGMIHITAFSNGEECRLKEGKTIEIGFPTNKKKDDMKLFTAFVDRRGGFDWSLATKPKDRNLVMTRKPEFKGGDSSLVRYLERNFNHPDLAKMRLKFERVSTSFVIDEDGEVVETTILHGISPSVDNEVVNMICNMPAWNPAIKDSEFVSVRIELPVYFGLDPRRNSTPYRVFDHAIPSTMKDTISEAQQYYFLDTPGLGWLNCDRFVPNSNNQIFAETNKGNVMNMQMVFHSMQAVISGSEKGGRFYFKGLPKGEPVTLFVFGYVDNKPCMAIKETTTDVPYHQIDLNQPLSKEKIEVAMEKISQGLMTLR